MGSKERFYADVMAMHPEVTGSCNLVIVKLPNGETIRFIVDCGLFHEKAHDELNSKLAFKPENIDFCLVTHNHVDHTGRLPLLVKEGFLGPIYATETTCKLLPHALSDTFRILTDVAKRKNQKCLYAEVDLSRTLDLLKPCKFNETIDVSNNVKVTFLKNGHLIGASMIVVQLTYPGYEDINLKFTGDYNSENIFFDVEPIPKWVLDLPLTVIQEATYGTMNSDEVEKVFENNVIKHIEKGATVIAPVFSLGRAQKILYVLKCMQDDGRLDRSIPIYFDGKLGIKYTNLYLNDELGLKEEMKDFLPDNLTFVDKSTRMDVVASSKCKIIVTTSGMGSYGPAQTYIFEYITRKNALIHFTGYTAEGTLGRKLKDAEANGPVEISGALFKKRATVEYTTEFSDHAKADEMIDFLNQFTDLKLVLINHGEAETKTEFCNRVIEEVEVKNVGNLGRGYFFRINHYGLVKTLSTKFE